jgi:hypothetical protein
VSKTDRSPELSFDITMVELVKSGDRVAVSRYGILEIQTMDFHGTYKHVAQNLRDALRLHGDGFHPPHPNWVAPAWIYVFDVEPSDAVTPNSIVIQKVIATDAEAMAYHALKVAPEAAVAAGGSVDRVLTTIYERLRGLWPDLLPQGGGVELFTLIRPDGPP